MANTHSETLLVLTSWNTASDDLTSQPTKTLVKDFRENTLKSDEVSKLYSTVLDVEVSEDQKKDAESVGVTLIPATRSKWADPDEDPPVVNWLFNHNTYYKELKDLQNVKHVVSFSPKTKNAAAAIHENLYPQAQFYQLSPPEQNGVLFTFDVWSKDACGLAGYHRSIIHDFCVRKGITGELLKAYSTVLDVKLTEDQKKDAEKCGVTLIPAKEKIGTMKKDFPNVDWLLKHESHYPDLGKLPNIKYVVGYAPKTGWAAADIRETLFPHAKLVLINHACPEENCVLKSDDEEDPALEKKMLEMASKANVLFSIGPAIFEYFQNAYRANVDGKQLSDIPHEEILPKLGQVYFDSQPVIVKDMKAHSVLTYGQLDSLAAVKRCTSMAAAVGTIANNHGAVSKKLPEWKICGISTEDNKQAKTILAENMENSKVSPKLYSAPSAQALLQSIQQSHLCLPPSCYTDYSFEGLEAMAAGLPTTVQDDSHIAAMIERHFEEHANNCIVTGIPDSLAAKITQNLVHNIEAFKRARRLKEDLTDSKAVTESLAKFATLLTGGEAETQDSDKQDVAVKCGMIDGVSGKRTITQAKITTLKNMQTSLSTVTKPDTLVTEDKNRTQDASVLSWMPVTGDTEFEETATQAEMSVTEDVGITETTAMNSGLSVTEDVEITETTSMNSGMSAVTEDVGITETTAMNSGMSVTEDVEITETTSMNSGMSVKEDVEITETTAMNSGMSVTEDVGITETTAMNSGMSVTKDMEITGTTEGTAVQPEMSITQDRETKETTAVHPGISLTENMEITETTAVHHGMSDKTKNPKMARGEKIRSGQCKQSKHEQTEINENGDIKTKQTKQQTQRTEKISTNASKPPPLDSTIGKDNTYSNAFTVHVGLTEESYQQQMRELDGQDQTTSVREKKEQLKAAWENIQTQLDQTESETIANNTSLQRVDQNCRNSFGEGTVTMSTKRKCLAISLDLPTLYNLYRLKQTCLSGSFSDSFELLLITDKMREEADKVGLQLKLKATYDQARFDELELFFINRDGGGLEPVKLYDDFNEGKDAEEILEEDTVTDQTSDTMVTERVDSSSQTEQGESLEDIQSKSEMERTTLESQLKEAKEEKGTLEERCKELTQKLESTEQSLVSQRIGNSMEREKLLKELKENQKLVKELQDKVTELEDKVGELENKSELSNLKKAGDKGDWSMTLVSGQHKDQGQKFKSPRGLAFHRDKLVVCDTGNNIVQILNKDYTCDKVIGSFDGQFAKPFRPLSVAISRFNHYFILDDVNKQIVVCDENGKIIKIITLPENIAVWDIALMDDFVLVTLRLTSKDTLLRPEDGGDRLVKYTQSGEYLAEVHGQIRGQGQFSWPVSMVVNSNNVIMVYDRGNKCIKCFDSDLNFLHQFRLRQLSGGIVGYAGYIAVDEDDNVYFCDVGFDRIVKYRCDGKWICELLEGNVRHPVYIAVMGDKIGVVEFDSDQINVFSK